VYIEVAPWTRSRSLSYMFQLLMLSYILDMLCLKQALKCFIDAQYSCRNAHVSVAKTPRLPE